MPDMLNSSLLKPVHNPVFPTDDNLEITLARFKSQLPIESENELFTLLMIFQNTLLKTLGATK